MKNRIISGGLVATLSLLLTATAVSAHVVVTPNEVGIGKFQTFTVGVPTEKDNPTVGLRLVLPEGLQEVTPNVKPGWTIAVKKSGDTAMEIDWTGGSVPAEQRDEFSFSVQVPSSQTTLVWKAYQTYQDGSLVSWDQKSQGSDDATGDKGPASETKVVNDLAQTEPTNTTDPVARIISYAAIALSVLALGKTLVKKL